MPGGCPGFPIYNTVKCFCLTYLFTCWFLFPPSLSLLQSLLQSISLFLFPSSLPSPFCYEGHQASGDPVPQEESKRSPSLLLFFHNLLFMSDRPPPDKWLPYGERKTERQSRRKEGKTFSVSSVFKPCVFLFIGFEILIVFWQCYMDCINVSCCLASCLMDGRMSVLPAVSLSWWRYQSCLIVKRCTASVGCKPQQHSHHLCGPDGCIPLPYAHVGFSIAKCFVQTQFKGKVQILFIQFILLCTDNRHLYHMHTLYDVNWHHIGWVLVTDAI